MMPNMTYNTLDPLFETIGLISVSRNVDQTRRETVKALDELGFDGEKFYATHMAVFDGYVQEFCKHYRPGANDALFFDDSGTGLLLLLMCLLFENRELIASVDDFDDSEINTEIMELCRGLYDVKLANTEGLDGLMTFVDACALTQSEKWKLLRIMKSPKAHIKQLVSTINANMSAFEKAKSKVRVSLEKLISQYAQAVDDGGAGMFGKFRKSLSETADVFPSLAFPVSQLMFSNSCYYGLMSTALVRQEGPDQELLLRRLKALSDGSRLEILRSIRQKPKYNLEIAEQLGLTAATMSHHMSVLLTCGFVGVNKQDSRVYYHLEEDAVRQFIGSLEQLLV